MSGDLSAPPDARGGRQRLDPIQMSPCRGDGDGGGDQEWDHTAEGRLVHRATGKCLQATIRADGEQEALAAQCSGSGR